MKFQTILYETDAPVATITLNRPERLNTIVPPMPDELEQAVGAANQDDDVRVIYSNNACSSECLAVSIK